jgi:tRNA(Ile)-lysidine synthase
MLTITGPIKDIQAVALSGGVDSMVAMDFIRRANPNVKVVHYNHGTSHGRDAEEFVRDFCKIEGFELLIQRSWYGDPIPCEKSAEEHWRDLRYKFFHSLELKIATAHHLNDVAETFIFRFLSDGKPRGIPYRNRNVVRPFLLTPKQEMLDWAVRNRIPYITDPSNKDTRYKRNKIREDILPQMVQANPGFLTVVRKQVEESLQID